MPPSFKAIVAFHAGAHRLLGWLQNYWWLVLAFSVLAGILTLFETIIVFAALFLAILSAIGGYGHWQQGRTKAIDVEVDQGTIGEHDLLLDGVETDIFVAPDDEVPLVRLRLSLIFHNAGTENLRWKIEGLSLSVGESSFATSGGEPHWTGVIAPGRLRTFYFPDLSGVRNPTTAEAEFGVQYGPVDGYMVYEMRKRLGIEFQRKPGDEHPSVTHHIVLAEKTKKL